MITVFSDNKEIPVNKVEFSDGAITYKLDELNPNARYISVNVDPSTKVNQVLEELRLFHNCLYQVSGKTYYDGEVILNLPYLPYARCDRVFEKGNPDGLESFLLTLDDMSYWSEVNICDIHNAKAVEDIICNHGSDLNIIEKSQLDCFKESLPFDFNTNYDYVVAPDKGAVEKARTIAEHLEVDIVFANKVRDVSTGKLINMDIPYEVDFTGKKVLIPDDIADNAGTHVRLADLLKQAGASQVDLYVTHAIFPKGMKHLTGFIDNVYCYQTVAGYINKQTVLDFNLGK